jgi:hypothetical protein
MAVSRKKDMLPRQRTPKLAIAIPASLTTDIRNMLEKTLKIGLIGRAAAIFRIDEILIYLDRPNTRKEGFLIATILRYMETPQYLRKTLFPLLPELRYAGILPPLRTPHHPLESKGELLKKGSFRNGVVIKSNRLGSIIDIGIDRPIYLPVPLSVKKRVTVKVIKPGKIPEVALARKEDIDIYWGYNVRISRKPLGETLREYDADFIIATSKYGDPVKELLRKISKKWKRSQKVVILFGSPTEGLREILARENLTMHDVADFVVNTIPEQGTETVRTEEAIYATLAILNLFLS